MANLNTTATIGYFSDGARSKKMLEVAQYHMPLERIGMFDPQAKNESRTRKWRRANRLSAATTPVSEGVTPTGSSMTFTDITATLYQYGAVSWITDVAHATLEHPVFDQTVDIMSIQAAETIETVRWNIYKAGTQVNYGGAGTTRATVNGPVTAGLIEEAVRVIRRNGGREFTSIIGASPLISTQPIPASFFAICHSDLEPDIQRCTGFVPVAEYSKQENVYPGEYGAVSGGRVRIITSGMPGFGAWLAAGTAGTTYLSGGAVVTASTACDVYPFIIFAKDSIGIVPFKAEQRSKIKGVEVNVKLPEVCQSDPLGQRGFVSWSAWQAAARLNEQWMYRLEVACTGTLT